jgi:hypothetical protein
LPLVLVLLTLLYFKGYERYYSRVFASLCHEQKVIQLDDGILLYQLLGLRDTLALQATVKVIESIDAEAGVYARVFDAGGRMLNRVVTGSPHEDAFQALLAPSHPRQAWIIGEITGADEGEFIVPVGKESLRVHHWRCHMGDITYYIIVGTVPDVLSRVVNMNHFTLGLLFLCLLVVCSSYWTIYLNHKLSAL